RLFDLSGSVPCFQRLNRKIGDGNAVVLTELVLDKHPSKLLQNALLPACRLGGGIRAPQKVAVWNFGSRYRNQDRKSTRLNSSHVSISYAVFCLKKKIDTVYTSIIL